ncbi:TRAP transporter large permease [Rhodoligotrophos defluvii]|uniref:TRAP transporter large permease n=1 Tax=Rhodoligotrophos defluvii TaxID=2561934 RepID=UPI0010CA0F80|nr:TRAP transporter large permease [Rhodoligotrophos defluvii]
MSSLAIGWVALAAALLLMAGGVPIGVAMGLVSFIGIWAIASDVAAWGMLKAIPYNFAGSWDLTAIPMFLLMGFIAANAGLTAGLFRAMRILLWRLPGGLACASVGACALFSAVSGSSVATAAAMAKITVPEMLRARYQPALATGVVASAGTLGSLIPPSVILVLYGIFAEVSIGALFVAAVIPGLLSALVFMLLIITRVSINPSLAPRTDEHFSRAEKLEAVREVWPLPVLIIGVIGGIMLGIFTPTEAGGVGAFLTLVIAATRGTVNAGMLKRACFQTLASTSSIFILIIGTALLTRLMAMSGVPDMLAEYLLGWGSGPIFAILCATVLYLILGCFLDPIGILMLTLPILLPILREADVNLIWFGILATKLLEIGLVTPPVGLNVYVIKGTLGGLVPLHTIFRGIGGFVAADLVTLTMLIAFPAITLFLPTLMR